MGQAKAKGNKAKDIAFAKSSNCIFCGGLVAATTVDHCPPRSMFVVRQWPEGFVFPACEPCNSGSSTAENILGFLSRLYSEKSDPTEQQVLDKYLKVLQEKYPKELSEMLQIPTSAKRRFARDVDLKLPAGSTHKDLPIVKLPKLWIDMVEEFGKKLTKAIHFHETGRICPPGSDVWVTLLPNSTELKVGLDPELLARMGRSHEIRRASSDLSDQFGYVTERTADGVTAMYLFAFNFSFKLICLYDDDGEKVRLAAQRFEAATTEEEAITAFR